MSNIINTQNRNDKNVITVTNSNIKLSEKLAEGYANSAKKDMQECADYLSAIQDIYRECQSVRDSINVTLDADLSNHIEDDNNPHNVTASQVDAYSKAEVNLMFNNHISSDELVTSISSLSTDSQHPSAKCVYELFTDMYEILMMDDVLDEIIAGDSSELSFLSSGEIDTKLDNIIGGSSSD